MENITIKDLMKYITEDLEDFDKETLVTYEVWAIGYDEAKAITDTEMFIAEFIDPDMAVKLADKITLADIVHQASEEDDGTEPETNVKHIVIEVETVVEDEEDGTMNVGTIYKRDLWIDGEYGDEEDAPEADLDELIHVKDSDYTLDDDGNLIISSVQFNHLNKNDIIKVMYDDEDYNPILTYKIISKTTPNKFICEFMY